MAQYHNFEVYKTSDNFLLLPGAPLSGGKIDVLRSFAGDSGKSELRLNCWQDLF